MKKKFLTLLVALIVSSPIVCSKTIADSELADAIKLYKQGNYVQCYFDLNSYLEKNTDNALAYYYLAMAATQLGKQEEAIANYDRAIVLSPTNNNLKRYAKKGKRCLETPDKCTETLYDSIEEEFIQRKGGFLRSEEVRSEYERLKIENFMRKMNRSNDIDTKEFKDYKDFSTMDNSYPTNDEIVAALNTLKRAGLSNALGNNYSSLLGLNEKSNEDVLFGLMNNSSLNSHLIQSLLTEDMQGF